MDKNNRYYTDYILYYLSAVLICLLHGAQIGEHKNNNKTKLNALPKPEIGWHMKWIGSGLLAISFALGLYWSREPDLFSVKNSAAQLATDTDQQVVTGYTTTATLYTLANTLLNKSGGFLNNDVMPPSVLLDNMPSWEIGTNTGSRYGSSPA